MAKINYVKLKNELKKTTSGENTSLIINAIKNIGWTEEELKDVAKIHI